jgi:hypothetical protein
MADEGRGGIHKNKAIISVVFRRLCQQVAYEVNSLPADLRAIATQGLVNAKYRGSQILPHVYPAQRVSNKDFPA